MNIRSLDIRQAFKFHLKFFGDVVRGAQGFAGVHDDVDFDDDAWSAVVGAYGVDCCDHGGMRHGFLGLVFFLVVFRGEEWG